MSKRRIENCILAAMAATVVFFLIVACGTTATESTVEKGDPEFTTLAEMSGKISSCQTGYIADSLIDSVISGVQYRYYNSRGDQLAALTSGKVDATPLDEPVAWLAVAQNPALVILPEQIVADQYGISLGKNSPLTPQVNAAIAQLRAAGTLEEMKQRWTGADADAKVLPSLTHSTKNGVLRVAHDSAVEPMAYVSQNGEHVGFDLELMLRIGEILERKVEFTSVDGGGLLSMLQGGKADAAVGCMSITEERKKNVDMSDAYYEGGLYFVVRVVGGGEVISFANILQNLKESFHRTFIVENRWMVIASGLGITVAISVCAGIFGTLLGFGICLMRRSKERLCAVPAAAFIRLVQGTPIVVLLMILYYLVFGKLDVSAILVAIVGFSLNFAAYISEMMRMGLAAVPLGQLEASSALGFTKTQGFWRISFPQAAQHVLPVFKGEFISMVKMTSVVGYIAIQDLTKVSDLIRSRTLEAFFPLIATAVLYFLVASVFAFLLSRVELKFDPKFKNRRVKGVVMHRDFLEVSPK